MSEQANHPETKPDAGQPPEAKRAPEAKQPAEGKQPKGEKAPRGDKPAKGEKTPKQAKGEKGEKGEKGQKKPKVPAEPAPPPRLRERFRTQVAQAVKSQFGVKNPMALPRLNKVVLTVGIGKQLEGSKLNPKARETVVKDLALITGQKPVVNKAKKSVANFKLREGYEVGAMVTLRGARMWEFVDRLISLAIPRIKDFRGLSSRSFDGRGNYSFGISEQGVFPEINMAEAEFTHGMNITFVFSNSNDQRSLFVLKEMGVPFAKPEDEAARKRN